MRLYGLDATSLALLLAACLGVLLFLYLQTRPARRVVVAALALWDQLGEGTPRRRAWSRERRVWWALLLSFAIVSALGFALGDPQPAQRAPRDVLLLLDVSPSMAARDAGGTRLSRARQLAHAEVRALGPRDHAWVVALDAGARVLTPRSADHALLDAAIASATTGGDADPSELARRLLTRPNAELVLISDGARPVLRAPARVTSRQLRVGQSARNVAVTQLSARAYPLDHAHQEILVAVENFGERDEPVVLRVSSQGVLLHEEALSLRAHVAETRVLADLPRVAASLRAELRLERSDVLPDDDVAMLQIPSTPLLRVLAVSRGNRYLEAALALDDTLAVEVATPDQYRSCAGHDLVIFDAVLPADAPTCAALYFAPADLPGSFPLSRAGMVARPYFERVDPTAPLTRDLALADVNVSQAVRVQLQAQDRALATSAARDPLMVQGTRAGLPFVAFTFDLRESDLPLRTAFPLLFLRTLDQLARRGGDQVSAAALRADAAIAPRDVLPRSDVAPAVSRAPFATPWPWLLAAALLLLAFEGLSFHRGWTP